MSTASAPALLTVLQVMERLQLSRDSVYQLIRRGKLVRKKLGAATRITRRSVELLETDGVREMRAKKEPAS